MYNHLFDHRASNAKGRTWAGSVRGAGLVADAGGGVAGWTHGTARRGGSVGGGEASRREGGGQGGAEQGEGGGEGMLSAQTVDVECTNTVCARMLSTQTLFVQRMLSAQTVFVRTNSVCALNILSHVFLAAVRI